MLRYCDVCNQTKDNTKNLGMNEQEVEYYRGYLAIWDKPNEIICPCCKQGTPVETNLTIDEFNIISKVSMYDRQFLEAMINLKQTDIIEYNLKMSQFKASLTTQKAVEESSVNSNQVHCIYCNSTNVKKISGLSKASSVAMWGIFSKKVHKEWHCNLCNSDF